LDDGEITSLQTPPSAPEILDLRQKLRGGLLAGCIRDQEASHRFKFETVQETMMRAIFLVIVAVLLAGCATTPTTNMTKVYDHKYNTTSYVAKQADVDFVGTSACEPVKAKPSWYRFGHP